MKRLFLSLIFCLISQALLANPQAGKEKSMMCAGCHDEKGISTNPDWPNLAGQHTNYLAKQLHDYQTTTHRSSPMMTPMVVQLGPEDIQNIAEYYATLPLAHNSTPKQYLTRGEVLYRQGDVKKQITACIACHGPQGKGNAQAGFPVLAGQQPQYTIQQLLAFKHKTRSNDLNSIMQNISAHMNKKDMEAIAYYLAGLH